MVDRLVADIRSHHDEQHAPKAPAPRLVPASRAGPPPATEATAAGLPSGDTAVRILRVAEDEIGSPRNDGTRGSGLYRVPLRLSHVPSEAWAQLFRETWDNPPEYSTMHRRGIASVRRNRIILDGTTIEEVEHHHAKTLRLVVEAVNGEIARRVRQDREQQAARRAAEERRQELIRAAAKRLEF